MQAEIQIEPIQRTRNVPRPIVSGGKAIVPSKGNDKTESIATHGFSLSNIEVLPVLSLPIVSEKSNIDVSELAHLMVEAVRNFSGNISDWQFSPSDSFDDLILRCSNRLKARAGIDYIEILRGDGYLRLVLKRHIGNRSTVYCIPLRPILPLRYKNPTLFHILFSFVKGLPYIDLFHTGEDRVDWLW